MSTVDEATTLFHPVCLMFPEMDAESLEQLAADIKIHGLHEPLWIYQGQIIDGRNRYLACQIAGVEPTFREWDGAGSLIRFVWSENYHRRHMTIGQKVAVAVELEELLGSEEEAPESTSNGSTKTGPKFGTGSRESVRQAGEQMGVSHSYVSEGKRIKRKSPAAFAALKAGELNVQQAKKKAGIEVKAKEPETPPGQCRVNGVLQTDTPHVAQLRREGHVPAHAIPDVKVDDEPETSEEDTESQQEAAEERQAIQADSQPAGDEEWLGTLPAYGQLEGPTKKQFREDALIFQRSRSIRDEFARKMRNIMNEFPLAKHRRKVGPYTFKIRMALAVNDPKTWVKCPPSDQCGCGGTGQTDIGECTNCHGSGYRIP